MASSFWAPSYGLCAIPHYCIFHVLSKNDGCLRRFSGWFLELAWICGSHHISFSSLGRQVMESLASQQCLLSNSPLLHGHPPGPLGIIYYCLKLEKFVPHSSSPMARSSGSNILPTDTSKSNAPARPSLKQMTLSLPNFLRCIIVT